MRVGSLAGRLLDIQEKQRHQLLKGCPSGQFETIPGQTWMVHYVFWNGPPAFSGPSTIITVSPPLVQTPKQHQHSHVTPLSITTTTTTTTTPPPGPGPGPQPTTNHQPLTRAHGMGCVEPSGGTVQACRLYRFPVSGDPVSSAVASKKSWPVGHMWLSDMAAMEKFGMPKMSTKMMVWNMYYISQIYGYLMLFSVSMWNFGGVREEMGPGRRQLRSRVVQKMLMTLADQDAACVGHPVKQVKRYCIYWVWFEMCTCVNCEWCVWNILPCSDWKCNEPCMVKMSPVNLSLNLHGACTRFLKPNQEIPTVVLVQLRCCSCSYPFRCYATGYLRFAFRILIAWKRETVMFSGSMWYILSIYKVVRCLLVLYVAPKNESFLILQFYFLIPSNCIHIVVSYILHIIHVYLYIYLSN